MNKPTTFYLVRHGETDWNKKSLLQGHTDIPLNKTGEQQAKELAKVFKEVNFDLAFSSDLLRAKRTAEIIVLEKKLLIETTKALRERSFGKLEGEPVAALLAEIALLKALDHEARKKHKMDENVETDDEIATRLLTFLRETAITHPGKTILITTHGGILRTILIHLDFLSYEKSDRSQITNAGYIKLNSDGVDFFLTEVNCVKERQQ